MIVNAILIPFFLRVFTNVSKESDFDPEYLFEMNKITTKYKPYIRSTELSSRITCHPFQRDSLRCFMHNITHVTSVNRSSDMNNRAEVGQWFEMKFFKNSPEVKDILVTEKVPTKFVKSFMKDIIHQFNIGQIDDIRYVYDAKGFIKSGYMGLEKTPIGKCLTTYITELGKYKNDTYEELDPNFQIRLLDGYFDQRDIHVRIEKNRKNCIYSMPYADFLKNGQVTSYFHIIEVIENKLRMYTAMNVYQSKEEWLDESIATEEIEIFFSQIMDLQLINITSQKTISFKDYNATKFDY